MSATEEHGLIPGGQDGAGGGTGGDPSPLGVRASPSGGMDGVERVTALLASLRPSRALGREDGGQEATQAAVEEGWDAELVEAEEEEEEEEGEGEGEEEEFELDIEDQEEDEYQSEEGDETEEEEEEETEEEEEEFELDIEDQEEDEYQSEEGDETEEEEEEEETEEEEEETEDEEEEMQMEEDMKEEMEEMEKTEEEEEEKFKLDIEDQEEDVYQSEEGDETAEEVEEDRETEEEDDNGQEGAGVVTGHGASATHSKSLLRDVVHCHPQPRHYNYRVLFGPRSGCVMVRRCCRWPMDPAEDGAPPQGQEDLGEADPPEGRELDSAADFKSGNVIHHLVMPKSVSFDTKEESEHQYENADEEKEDGNEKPEEGPKLDMVSAEGSSGEYSWKA